MIVEDEVRGAVHRVQDYVSSPHFTQTHFLSDSCIAMLTESAAVCDNITSSAALEPWRHVETAFRSQVVAEVCACVTRAVDRRRAVNYSQEQWYAVRRIRLLSEDSRSRLGVRISDKVEEGRVDYVPVRVPSISAPGKSKKRKVRRSPEATKAHQSCKSTSVVSATSCSWGFGF